MYVIKNMDDLLTHGDTDVREPLLAVADTTLERIRADRIVRDRVGIRGNLLIVRDRKIELNFRDIYVVGFGKASVPMAAEMERILGDRLSGGMVNSPYPAKLSKIEVNVTSHPYPDRKTLEASLKILEFLKSVGKEDLVIVLLSGGASSLFEVPVEGLTIEEEAKIIKKVMLEGADIIELNMLRIALSKVKGGGLLDYIYPARCVSLIISDVIGDPKFVGSGPTYSQEYDVSTILKKYDLPVNLGKKRKSGHKCENVVLADNGYALKVACEVASSMGYAVKLSRNAMLGEPSSMARKILDEMRNFRGIMIWGGETNVKVEGNGIGGRNQELALYLSGGVRGCKMGFLCVGTDGIDGPTDAAGGIVDGGTMKRLEDMGIDVECELARHNSYFVLKKLGDLIITGYTGTNLADICVGYRL